MRIENDNDYGTATPEQQSNRAHPSAFSLIIWRAKKLSNFFPTLSYGIMHDDNDDDDATTDDDDDANAYANRVQRAAAAAAAATASRKHTLEHTHSHTVADQSRGKR